MTEPSEEERAPGRRLLVATAMARYAKAPQWDRPQLGKARQQVIDLFTATFGYSHLSGVGLNPTEAQLTGYLRQLCRHRIRPQDYLVVYIAGHGEVLEGGRHVLLTADTDPRDVPNALSTMRLADKMLLGTPVQRLLLLLDTCYSGQGGNQLAAAVLAGMEREWTGDRSGLVVVTSTQPFEQADAGAFPDLLTQAVHGLPTAGHLPPTLDLDAVVHAMNTHPDRPGHQRIGMIALGLTGHSPDFLPNPRHGRRMTDIDLHMQQVAEWGTHAERREVEFRRRFLVRAMGGPTGAPAWWFTGRHAALTDITTWLTTPTRPAALVVTGGPGSGKSAVLGLVSALTHPEHRRTVPLDAIDLPPRAIPPLDVVDVTIYAGGLTHEQVLAGIAAAAQIRADTIGELLAALDSLRGERGRPFTAIIDALDEASDPHQLVTQVLGPIIDHDGGQAIRLLLGTRSHLLGLLNSQPTHHSDTAIATIGLDDPAYADQDALTAYTIRSLMEASPHSPYLDIPPRHARAVATAVAEAATPSFLVARITSTTLASDDIVADPADQDWRASLPGLPGEAMRNDLDARLGEDAQRARDLLRPLAYAAGQGLPWEDIWAPLATAISGRRYTDTDLFWLRKQAGSYVVEATESGRSAYRLYHQALAEYLRADTEASGLDEAMVQRAFVEVLSRLPRDVNGTRDWNRAHPYTLRHLASHAAAAGIIDTLLTDAEYLIHAAPDTLLPALHDARATHARLVSAIYRASADRHRHGTLVTRRQLLAVDATRCGADAIGEALSADLPWRPRWATGSLISPHLRMALPDPTQPASAVACTHIGDVPVAITCAGSLFGSDCEVVVWNLRSGQQYGTINGHTQPIGAVACGEVDGVPVVITAAIARDVVVLDLVSGQQRAALTGHTHLVSAVACGQVDGVPIAITTGGAVNHDDTTVGEVLVWDLRSGQRRATLTGHTRSVSAVACGEVDGVPVAVTAGGGEVLVWDLRSGQRRATVTGHTRSVLAVACTQVNGVPIAITATEGGEVLVWDLRSGQRRATLTGHTQPVNAVACTQADGVPIAITVAGPVKVSGGGVGDGEVLVWDLRSGQRRATLPGHTQPVNTVACVDVDGVPTAITGAGNIFSGGAGEVLLWDLRTGAQPTTLPGHTKPVSAVACGQIDGVPIATTAASDGAGTLLGGTGVGEVLLWDLRTGRRRATLTGHTQPVYAVTCGQIDGVPIAITGGGRIMRGPVAEVLMWDLRSGQKRATLTGHTLPVNAVACTEVGNAPIAITGGGTIFGNTKAEVLLWDLRTGRQRATLTGHTQPVYAVACGQIDGVPIAITGGGNLEGKGDAEVLVWDLRTGRRRATLAGHTQPVRAVACTQVDGVPVAITGASAGADAGTIFGGAANVHTGDDGEVLVWDLRTGRRRATLTGHTQPVSAVACTQVHGVPLAMIAAGGDVLVWDLLTGQKQQTLAMPHRVASLAIGASHEIAVGAASEIVVLEPQYAAGPTRHPR